MKRGVIFLVLLLVGVLVIGEAQVLLSYRLLLWTAATGYTWPTLGKSFVVQNGVVDVLLPPAPTSRQRHVQLVWDATAGGFRFPVTNPTAEDCDVNSLRYHPPKDYTIKGNLLVPGTAGNWPPFAEAQVFCEYEVGSGVAP